MILNIINAGLRFNESLEPLNLSRVDSISLHHMAHKTADIYAVHQWHLAKGWKGIGYGFWVSKDGKIYEGRGMYQNAGVEGQNGHIISIGFQGDYNQETEMPTAQFNAGVGLIAYLKAKVPSIKYVDGHCRWNPTSCPGKYFPLKQMIDAKPVKPIKAIGLDSKQIIQERCKFSNPDDVWTRLDAHPYAEALYKKWADSYS